MDQLSRSMNSSPDRETGSFHWCANVHDPAVFFVISAVAAFAPSRCLIRPVPCRTDPTEFAVPTAAGHSGTRIGAGATGRASRRDS
jgi:hypothetical protein